MIDHSSFCSVIFQVVDTPYLVHPEWKNFIPGYLYNDSDMELTAESFYRQSKLVLFISGTFVSRVIIMITHTHAHAHTHTHTLLALVNYKMENHCMVHVFTLHFYILL